MQVVGNDRGSTRSDFEVALCWSLLRIHETDPKDPRGIERNRKRSRRVEIDREESPMESMEVEARTDEQTSSPPEEPEAVEAAQEEVLPVPAGPLRGGAQLPHEKPSFWRRIKMRRRDRVYVDGGSQEAMSARMSELEHRLEQTEGTLLAQLQHVEHRLDEVWEVEEQLSHLIEIGQKLDGLAGGQREAQQANERLERSLRLVAGFTGVMAIVVLAAIAIVLNS